MNYVYLCFGMCFNRWLTTFSASAEITFPSKSLKSGVKVVPGQTTINLIPVA